MHTCVPIVPINCNNMLSNESVHIHCIGGSRIW